MRNTSESSLCLIIPCYNEEAVLPTLLASLDQFARKLSVPVKVLFVDDGSWDETANILDKACEERPQYGCIHFSRNFGHQTAVSAGLKFAQGDMVVVIDADLQDPPEVILEMIERWREGYDVVYGIRTNRKESRVLKVAYAGFYRMMKSIANIDLPLDAGDFSLMDRSVVDILNRMPEHNRFVRGLRGWVGFRQVGVPYDRAGRHAGATKYSLRRLVKLALDGLISFSTLPLRLAVWAGTLSSLIGFILMIWAAFSGLFLGKTPSGWASLAVIMLFFGGIQLLVLGIVGEYVGRIFDEVKNRPHFIVQSSAGWVEGDVAASHAS